MKQKAYGYGNYRGRNRGSLVLKILIGVLLVVLLAALGFFFLFERYMVYDDSGRARLELPFFGRKEGEREGTEDPVELPPVVTKEPDLKEPEIILPVTLPIEALYDGTATEMVTAGGGTAALFDMKPASGMLEWVSDLELSISARASLDDPDRNTAMQAAAEKENVYRIARVSCFRDDRLAMDNSQLALYTASGYRWLDMGKMRWVIPTSPVVQEYLVGLCKELAELGFDEILLENAGYPTKGQLNYIKKDEGYNAGNFESVVTGFYETLTEALKESGVALAVVYDPDTTALSGQSEKAIRKLGMTPVILDEGGNLRWQR